MSDMKETEALPPEWMTVSEARKWITRRYGMRASAIIDDLVDALRGDFPHRVADWNGDRRQWRFRKEEFPPGYDSARFPHWMKEGAMLRLRVSDWELANVDWQSGTVLAFGGHRSAIEVRWADVRHLARTGELPPEVRLDIVQPSEGRAYAGDVVPSIDPPMAAATPRNAELPTVSPTSAAGKPSQPKAPSIPRVSQAALEEWHRKFVDSHDSAAPGAKWSERLKAVRAHFPSHEPPTRERMRALPWPESWSRLGVRAGDHARLGQSATSDSRRLIRAEK